MPSLSALTRMWREGGMPLAILAVAVVEFAAAAGYAATHRDQAGQVFWLFECAFLVAMILLALYARTQDRRAAEAHAERDDMATRITNLETAVKDGAAAHAECERRYRTLQNVVMRFLAFEADNKAARDQLIAELRELEDA